MHEKKDINVYIKSDLGDVLGHAKLKKRISETLAQELIDAGKQYKFDKTCCYTNGINIYRDTHTIETEYGPATEQQLIIDTKKPVKMPCISNDLPIDIISQDQCVKMCSNCISAGRCTDAQIINTIGIKLFPEMYIKIKQS